MALKIYIVTCIFLYFKMVGLGFLQGYYKAKTNSFTNPEDAKLFANTAPVEKEPPELTKANNAYRNDLENIPIFLFLALCYVLAGCWETGALIYFPLFCLLRLCHTIFYVRSMQPWRTIAYSGGSLVSFAIIIHLLYYVLTK